MFSIHPHSYSFNVTESPAGCDESYLYISTDGALSGRMSSGCRGLSRILIEVLDSGESKGDYMWVLLDVENNGPEVVKLLSDEYPFVLTEWTFSIPSYTFYDADDDPLTYELIIASDLINSSDVQLEGQQLRGSFPTETTNQQLTLIIKASDPYNVSANTSLTIYPFNNHPKAIQTIEDISIFAYEALNEKLDLQEIFEDVDQPELEQFELFINGQLTDQTSWIYLDTR